MLKNIEDKKLNIWDEIIKEAQELSKPLQEDEMTARTFAEATGKSFNIAKKILDRKVFDGTLITRQAILNGHNTTIYCPAKAE